METKISDLTDNEISEAICKDINVLHGRLYSILIGRGLGRMVKAIFRNNTTSVGIVVGINFNGKNYLIEDLIKDFELKGSSSILSNIKFEFNSAKYPLIIQIWDEKSNKLKLIYNTNPDIVAFNGNDFSQNSNNYNLFNIVVKNSELSAKVFGLKKNKSSLEGNKFSLGEKGVEFKYGKSGKLNSETYYALVPFEGKKIKFVIEDLQLEIKSLKGWNFPKDLTIREGDYVRILGDKTRQPWEVLSVKRVNSKIGKRINRRSSNFAKDILKIGIKSGVSFLVIKTVFAKHVKKLINEEESV